MQIYVDRVFYANLCRQSIRKNASNKSIHVSTATAIVTAAT